MIDFTRAVAAIKRFSLAMRGFSGELASQRSGYPLLHELDEIEWRWREPHYYRDHPYVRALERRYPRDHLLRGAARVLYAPVTTPVPTTIADVMGWTDLGAAKNVSVR